MASNSNPYKPIKKSLKVNDSKAFRRVARSVL